MINRQVTDVKNIPNFTPQASLIFTPQTQPMLNVSNLKQQPLITALNPQLSQMQPVYIIANNPGVPLYNPLMYPLNPAMQFNSAPLQYIYYPQTFRQNTNQIQIRPNLVPSLKQIEPVEKADAKPTSALKPSSQPPPPERPKTKEITLLYRYQKPITVDGLKHPNDKYKNLIYKPKFITSRNIEPLTEELVPKLDESAMTPIIDVKSRLNFTPVSTQRPKLVGDLKLPVEKQEPEKISTTRLPVLVEDLKLPIEKSTPEPESKPEPVPQPQPIKEIPKFLTSSKISLSYNGKFHYPPEIDFNDATDFKDNFKYERLDDFNNYRPKSTIVNVLVEKDTFELAKILFNPNVIVEFNQLIETQNLSNEKTSRPKSSRIKENEEKKPKLNKVLKNVQEIHENYKMEQSSLNDNLRVPSRQSIKTTKHNENNQVNKRALSNAFQVNENVQNHEIKIEDNLRVKSPEKLDLQEEKENFEDQSNEKFISQIPIRTDVENDEVDDAEDEVNIEQYERVIKQMSPQKKHDHHFHFHGGNRICCSAHRKHDPYYHIESKIKSFENFGYYPHHSNLNILSERTNYKKKFKNQTSFKNNEETLDKKTNNKNILLPPIKDNKTVQFDGYRNLVKYPDGSIRIFSQNLQWTESSKIGQISFENIDYKNHQNNFEVFSERLNWRAESKISKIFYENIRFTPRKFQAKIFSQKLDWKSESRIKIFLNKNSEYKKIRNSNKKKIFSEKLNWNKESKIKAISDLDLSQLNTQRSSQLLIFHELPKWKDLVDSKVKSFENFHYRPSESRLKIYDEKIRWNSESRLKPLLISQHDFSSKSQSKFYTHRDLIQHRPDWFPGDKQETFNAFYRTNFNENFRPVINEKTNWNVQSRLKAISWENFNYNSQNKKKKQSDLKNKIKPIPEKKTIESQKSSKKKIELAEIWSREYNRIKQENKQKRNQVIKQSSKTPRITNMETPDLNKISSRQSFSKYKELPPIKSGKENNFNQQLNLEQRIDTPWNLNSSSQRSFSRMFNPELNNQSQKRLKYDSELKRRSVDQIHHNSTLSQYQDEERNQSQFGTELINDLRLPRITSPNRKSTPDTSRLISNLQTPSGLNTTFDQQSVIQERQIKKRSKQSKESISSRGKESRLSKQHEPQLDGFQLSGSTLKIDGNAKVRPLANMSYKNAEDKAKIRATSRLYSSLMTPRSYYSNDTAMNYFN